MRLWRPVLAAAALVAAALVPPFPLWQPASDLFNPTVAAQHEEAALPRAGAPLTILQINDVYSTVPVDGFGGLARVATLKKRVAEAGGTPLLVIAGDFLSSSIASTVFKGEQMVAALNAAGLDLATLGNHEFDFGIDLLRTRMAEAKWTWVVSNVIDRATGKPVGGAAPYVVRTFGTMKVGFIGLCLATEGIRSEILEQVTIVPPLEAARRYLPMLRRERVDAIVAITHLLYAEDRELAARFPEIDVIVGGHEHFPITATQNRTLISKAGSDAKFVARIDLKLRGRGQVERLYELLPITAEIPDDPATAVVVNDYESRLGLELEHVIGATKAPLDSVALRIRAAETTAGNLVADAVRASAGADVAIINSGGVRGNRVLAEGPLTRRAVIELHPLGNVVCTLSAPGQLIIDALEHGFARLPAPAGQFPQVSGLTVRVDSLAPAGSRVREVRIGGAPLDPRKTYTLAIPDFILDGGDAYTVFKNARVLVGPEDGEPLVSALERYITARGELSPQVEGRIVIAR